CWDSTTMRPTAPCCRNATKTRASRVSAFPTTPARRSLPASNTTARRCFSPNSEASRGFLRERRCRRNRGDTRASRNPRKRRFPGKYYLFVSGGFVWSSDDLVHWKHQPATMPAGSRVTAPAAFEYQGNVYLTGNDTGLYRARHPAGPYEYIGDFKDDQGKKMLLFDTMVFVDDDGRVYAYYSGRHTDGIYGVELDRKDLTRFVSPPKKFWT